MVNFERNTDDQQYWPWWRLTFLGLNTIALILSAILSWHYLKGESMPGCGGGGSCEQVLNSRWSLIGGILPVSSLAVGVYLAMLVTGFFIGPSTDVQIRRLAWKLLLVLVGSVGGSAIWFMIVQKWFIGEFCLYCMTIHITGLLLTVLAIWQGTKILHNNSDLNLSTTSKNVQDNSRSSQLSMISLMGMVLIGLTMSGILAFSQAAIAPKTVYYSGKSRDNLPGIDYNSAPIIGSPDAPYVVKLLFDYQCSHCQKMHFMLNEAVRRYAGKLAFVLCPAPLNTQCNPYIPGDVDAFKNSCELARIGLAVWLSRREAFPAFENWMFSFDSGDRWHSRSVEAAHAKAIELVGKEKFDNTVVNDWVDGYLQTCIQIYGQTIESGKSGIPKLVFGSRWVIPEPKNEDELIMILQTSLGVPKP
jgi:uncharacterized membrane protein